MNFLFTHSVENDESVKYLARVNNRSEWIWKLFLKGLIFGGLFFTAMSSIISCFVCQWRNDGEFVYECLYLDMCKSIRVRSKTKQGKYYTLHFFLLQFALGSAYTIGIYRWDNFWSFRWYHLSDCRFVHTALHFILSVPSLVLSGVSTFNTQNEPTRWKPEYFGISSWFGSVPYYD